MSRRVSYCPLGYADSYSVSIATVVGSYVIVVCVCVCVRVGASALSGTAVRGTADGSGAALRWKSDPT